MLCRQPSESNGGAGGDVTGPLDLDNGITPAV
jgi:hypothetical protein